MLYYHLSLPPSPLLSLSLMSALFFDQSVTFSSLPLDRRLFKAIARLRLIYPSLIQAQSLPLALQGKDLLISSRTGTGKTFAYLLPLLQLLLPILDATPPPPPHTRALILVPTRELALQVHATLASLTFYLPSITSLTLTADAKPSTQLPSLTTRPLILIATPGRLREHLEGGAVDPSHVSMLVLDEADLLLTFAFEDDVKAIHRRLPSTHQTILLSATPPSTTAAFTSLLSHPVTLTLDLTPPSTLTQHYISIPTADKALLLYSLLRLGLVKGRCLLFTNSVEGAFRLKLLLEQFSISSGVINEQLPFNARMNVLQQFNRGMFDYLIATDRSVEGGKGEGGEVEAGGTKGGAVIKVEEETKVKDEDETTAGVSEVIDVDADDYPTSQTKEEEEKGEEEDGEEGQGKRRQRGRGVKREFDMSRGIDFVDVSTVLNVDFPLTPTAYIHRIGRTARAGKTGTAISLVTPADASLLQAVLEHQIVELSSTTLNPTPSLTPLSFNTSAMESFRYRVEDVSRAVTAARVHAARVAEQRQALLSSTRLKAYYEDNPAELGVLRADRGVRGARVQPHLARVPGYLVPEGMTAEELGGEGGKMGRSGDKRKGKKGKGKKRRPTGGKKGKDDPLRSAGKGRGADSAGEGGGGKRRKKSFHTEI